MKTIKDFNNFVKENSEKHAMSPLCKSDYECEEENEIEENDFEEHMKSPRNKSINKKRRKPKFTWGSNTPDSEPKKFEKPFESKKSRR